MSSRRGQKIAYVTYVGNFLNPVLNCYLMVRCVSTNLVYLSIPHTQTMSEIILLTSLMSLSLNYINKIRQSIVFWDFRSSPVILFTVIHSYKTIILMSLSLNYINKISQSIVFWIFFFLSSDLI